MRGVGARVLSSLLWTGAVLGVLSMLVAVLAAGGVVRPLVFTSGSMEPDIPEGSLALSRTVQADDIAVGDVVNVARSDGQQVTHRVVAVDQEGKQAALTLQGDANPTPDAETYSVGEAHRVFLHVSWLGHLATAFKNPIPSLMLVLFLVWLILSPLLLQRRRRRPPRRAADDSRRPRRSGGAAVVLAAILLAPAGVAQTATPTLAGFTDSAAVTTGTTSSHTMVPQAAPTCTDRGGLLGLLGYAELTWSYNDTRYEYEWTAVRVSNGTQLANGVIAPTGASGSTVMLEVRTSLLNLGLGEQNVDISVRARLRGANAWVAAPTTTRVHTAALLVGLSVRCGSA